MLIGTARAAADLLGPVFADTGEERFAVLHLDAEQRLIALDEWPAGDRHEIDLPMREIFTAALKCDAFGLVIAHNHPSGDPQPSRADIEATRRLAQAAAALDICLHDHLIFAGGECCSFRELALL